MKIEIIGDTSAEPAAFAAACQRLLQWGDPDLRGVVYTKPRDVNGFLHWNIHIFDKFERRSIVLGMVERSVGAGVEFHS